MQTSSRSRPPTSRPDPMVRVIAVFERAIQPLTVATLRHTAGVSAGVLELMVEHGELEIVDRGLLRLVRREPRQ